MKVGFTDGEITQYKIYDSQGRIVETLKWTYWVSPVRNEILGGRLSPKETLVSANWASAFGRGYVKTIFKFRMWFFMA